MKITKSSKKIAQLNINKMLANIGCNICPCCGEEKSILEYVKEGICNKGIVSELVSTTWTKGLFKFKHMQADCYKCETCGAEWQSDPYEVVE